MANKSEKVECHVYYIVHTKMKSTSIVFLLQPLLLLCHTFLSISQYEKIKILHRVDLLNQDWKKKYYTWTISVIT